MKTTEKRYPFSTAKHAHDIEFYHNRIWNTARKMETGEIPMDKARYERITAMLDGDLRDLMNAMCGACGRPVFLTGKQIALAKNIVIWASETRVNTCIKQGRYDLIRYC